MVAEGAGSYTRMRDARKDERIVRLYAESLEQQIDATIALKTRFFSEVEVHPSDNIAVLKERKGIMEAFLAALQAVKEGVLEAQRMRVVRGKGDRACRVGDVKSYIGKLDEMEGIVKEHRRLFSCRAPDSYLTIFKDLKKRRVSAGLLLAGLSGRRDAKIAENQGQAETWTREFLAEIQGKAATEHRQQVEDLLTGAIIGGASVWFGAPWARRAIVGAVSSLVGKARDGASEL
ncbi:hypothetical protein GSI_14372 [Ganoderma sinense ZZ0214-1]|uniref:Uncharacterized protein n=1 Tax=Ganoderma sinense ZZ0214-1 TaxID=1077348 RepID=A0A2G8RNG6_9APHY|nr:hypothetical protein GSI_14372 [Ganoderma sinense ZZ0214-1]